MYIDMIDKRLIRYHPMILRRCIHLKKSNQVHLTLFVILDSLTYQVSRPFVIIPMYRQKEQ